ncbi:MAG TPA: ABC transporter substrate-binding protein [Paracoccaceae bacterium]|nr:ABC transporter substrate-binding protein [Paracoccaceae bacterium]
MTFRELLASALALALLAGPAAAQDRTLTISLWGFNGEKLEQHLLKPFRETHNVDIVLETGNNADRLSKLKIRGGEGIDLIYLTDSFSQVGIEDGLFAEIDPAKIPNLAGVYDIARQPQGPYGPAYTVGRIGIVYDSAKVAPLASWADLWREDLRGQVSIPEISTTTGPMMVLAAARVAGTDAYDDPDAAFAKLAELKPNVVKAFRTGSELVNLFSTGEISVAVTQDFVMGPLQAAVPTVAWAELEEGSFAVFNTINVVKGTPNLDLALDFINFALDPAVQKTLAAEKVDAPIVASVELTPEEAKGWTYGADTIASLNRLDYAKLNAAKSDWTERWTEIFGQ